MFRFFRESLGTYTASSYSSATPPANTGPAITAKNVAITAQTIDVDGQILCGESTPSNWSVNLPTTLKADVSAYQQANNLAPTTSVRLSAISTVKTVDSGDSLIDGTYDPVTNQITLDDVTSLEGEDRSISTAGSSAPTRWGRSAFRAGAERSTSTIKAASRWPWATSRPGATRRPRPRGITWSISTTRTPRAPPTRSTSIPPGSLSRSTMWPATGRWKRRPRYQPPRPPSSLFPARNGSGSRGRASMIARDSGPGTTPSAPRTTPPAPRTTLGSQEARRRSEIRASPCRSRKSLRDSFISTSRRSSAMRTLAPSTSTRRRERSVTT